MLQASSDDEHPVKTIFYGVLAAFEAFRICLHLTLLQLEEAVILVGT